MLLEDLESGKSARAARLTGDQDRQKQMLTVFGLKDANAEFQIAWNNEIVSGISIYATPAELKSRLEEFTFIEPGDLVVQFGNHTRAVGEEIAEFPVFRWIVKFRPGLELFQELSEDERLMVPTITDGNQTWMGAEETQLEDAYDLKEVCSLLPVGVDLENNTPMQAGAICLATKIRPFGWVVDAVEARHLTGDFIEIVYAEY